MHPLNHNDKALWLFVFLSFLFTFITFAFSQYQIFKLKNSPVSSSPAIVYITGSPMPTIVPTPIASVTPSPKPTPTKSSSAAPQASIVTYIPLTGGSTTNTDWTNINSTSFIMNFSDYGSKAVAVWDANLRVDNANGQTSARLYDTTHNIAVNGSEINISNTSTSTDVVSGSLQFWQGNNTYVIQLKSLNSSTAFIDSGRIKITY